MSDHITVTFGGREVRLEQMLRAGFWSDGFLTVNHGRHPGFDGFWRARAKGRDERGYGDNSQAAVSALEAKLREHYQAIGEILGEQSTGHRGDS